MSKNEEDPPNSGDADANLDVDNNGEDGGGDGDDDHGEAAEILTDLLQNGQIIPASANGDNADAGRTDTSSGATEAAAAACRENTQVGEAQQAAIQQMMQHLKLGGVALPSASADQEKRHAFWDTQVRMHLRADSLSFFIYN